MSSRESVDEESVAAPGSRQSLHERSFRLRYGRAARGARVRRFADGDDGRRSPFGDQARRHLDRRSFRLRYASDDDSDADSDELTSDEDPDFTFSYSRSLPQESHNVAFDQASNAASSGGDNRGDDYTDQVITLSVLGTSQEENAQPEDDGIGWIADEELPPISPEFKKKASTVLKAALTMIDDYDEGDEEEKEKRSCLGVALSCLFSGDCCRRIPMPKSGPFSVKPVSAKLKKAQKIGLKLGQKLLFPAIPKLLRDLWVGMELAASVIQFILGCLQLNFNSDVALGTTIFVLTVISFVLGLLDAWTYFYSMGSCHDCLESAKQRRRGEGVGSKEISELTETAEEEGDELPPPTGRQKLKLKWKKVKDWLEESFELLRTVLSELLLYPLIIFDLTDLLGDSLDVNSSSAQVSFSLFLLGGVFLVLSVYIVRFIILSTTVAQLNRIPITSLKKRDHITTITRFLIHVILQVIVHFLCIVAVGVKIRQENFEKTTDSLVVSPFLWYTMVAGWVLPFLGILSFFIVKYYWFEELSAGMYLDMLAMLQTQGFAEAVFHNKATELAGESAEKFLEKIDHTKESEEKQSGEKSVVGMKNPGFRDGEGEMETALVENHPVDSSSVDKSTFTQALQDTSKDYMKTVDFARTKAEYEERQESTSYAYKFLYPLKIPLFALFALFYDAVFLGFCGSLLLTSDGQGSYRISAFDGGSFSISIIVCVVFILIANINILIAINLWVVVLLLGMTIFLPLLPIVIFAMFRRRKASQIKQETNELPQMKVST